MKTLEEPHIIGYLCNKENSIEIPLYEGINEISSDIFKENSKFKFLQNLQFVLFKLNIQSIDRAYLRSYEQFPLQLKFEKNNSIDEYFLCKSGIVTISSLYDLQIKILNSKISFGKFQFKKNIQNRKEKNYGRIEIIDLSTPVSAETIDNLSTKEKCNSFHISSICDENKSQNNPNNLHNDSVDSEETEEIVYTSRILESAEQFVKKNLQENEDKKSFEISKFNSENIVCNMKKQPEDKDVEANVDIKNNVGQANKSLNSINREENFSNLFEIKPYALNNYNVIVIPKKLLINNHQEIFDFVSLNKSKNDLDKTINIEPENPQKNKVISSYNLRKKENSVIKLSKRGSNKSNIGNDNKSNQIENDRILRKRPREDLTKMISNTMSNQSTNTLNNNTSKFCMICLDLIKSPSKINTCAHMFCKECIDQWTEVSNSCPLCKKEFKKIIYYTDDNKLLKERKVRKKKFKFEDEEENDAWIDQCLDHCMKCKQRNDVYLMLVCDKCHYNVCHTYCAGLDKIPEEDWICSNCDVEKSQIQTRKENKIKKKLSVNH